MMQDEATNTPQAEILTPEANTAPPPAISAKMSLEPATAGDIDELKQHMTAVGEAISDRFSGHLSDLRAELLEKIETSVAKIAGSQIPAKTEAIASAGGARGVAPGPAAAAATETNVEPFEVGDRVKIWANPEHTTFRTGEIVGAHPSGFHDVKLDDGTVTHIPHAGMALDERA